MIKKYPWYFVFVVFVILCLANIFLKLQWNTPTDNIVWEKTSQGLVCKEAPENSQVKTGDILHTINSYVIKSKTDLAWVISKRKYCRYEIERDELLKDVGVEISTRYTSFSYYILAFSGILMLLLTLRILNINIQKRKGFSPPPHFYLMTLTFSGFLIFSPTSSYAAGDFIYLFLDRVCFLFFPAFLLQYSLYFPIKSRLLRKFNPMALKLAIYIPPSALLLLNVLFLVRSITAEDPYLLQLLITNFRQSALKYFALYLYISLIFFLISNLTLIIRKKEKRFILPLAGISTSITLLLIFYFLLETPLPLLNLVLLLLALMPVSLTYFLGHRKFTDIENVIRKTVSITLVFPFIFGIYFFLGSTIEQNKLLGIFWSITAILTAGLLYKPIETTVHLYFEKFFLRGSYNFKRKLRTLMESMPTERDLYSLSTSFLDTINNGFQLQDSTLIVHHRKNIFHTLPDKKKLLLSSNFRNNLFRSNQLVLYSTVDFQKRYPKDYRVMKEMNYFQFLPLKTPDKLIGLVAFGPKQDNTYLSVEDWELLFSISSPLSLSVENAVLYSELTSQLDEINLLKEFNEDIIENISLGIVVLSGLNIIKTWNSVMEEKFKIPAEKAINSKGYSIFGGDLWKKVFGPRKGISTLDNVAVDIDGEELVFDIFISPLKDNSGRQMGTIMVFEDVTEKVMIQNQLLTSEKMASLGLLSAGVAHEVNTPLTGISSYCQLILDNPEDPENIEMISRIQEQVQRANKIIRSLLDFSRQKGEQPMELDINKIINESIALVEHKLKKKNIQLELEYDFQHKVHGFSTRLQQLFINLLINAADAISNVEDGRISISGFETENQLFIRLKDNGQGMDLQLQDKIFDPFFTTKAEGKGTGLGLSIAYTIVEEHYGEIKVNSKVNKGTTFTITLPVRSPLRSMKL